MAKRLEEIFEECLERIEKGESIESCLASYPEESAELEFMLRTFINVQWRSSLVEPSPQFKAWGKAQLYNAFNAERARQAAAEPKRHGILSLRRIWVPALAGLMIFILLGGVGTAAASGTALPDQPLYGVKLATEQVRLAFSFSDVDKAEVNTQIAETRAQEIAAMAELGKTEYVVATTERMLDSLESAEQAINRVFGEAPDLPPEPQFEPQPVQQPEPQPEPQPVQQPEPQPEPQPVQQAEPQPVQQPEPQPEPQPGQQPEPQTGEKPVQPSGTKPDMPSDQQTKPQPASSTNETGIDRDSLRDQGTVQQVKSERISRSFEATLNKNVTVLEEALNKAPEGTKSAIQNALDITRTKKQWIESQNRFRWWERNRNNTFDKNSDLPQKDILQESNNQSGNRPAGTTNDSGKPPVTFPEKDIRTDGTNATNNNTTTDRANITDGRNTTDSSVKQNTSLRGNYNTNSTDFKMETTLTPVVPSNTVRSLIIDTSNSTGVR
jgi:outer membrane biosynthesis protein TonB